MDKFAKHHSDRSFSLDLEVRLVLVRAGGWRGGGGAGGGGVVWGFYRVIFGGVVENPARSCDLSCRISTSSTSTLYWASWVRLRLKLKLV